MITDLPPVPVKVRIERMRMALAEIGIDGSPIFAHGDHVSCWVHAIPLQDLWRAEQIAGHHLVYCYACWEADGYREDKARTASCCAPPGIVDCGRTHR